MSILHERDPVSSCIVQAMIGQCYPRLQQVLADQPHSPSSSPQLRNNDNQSLAPFAFHVMLSQVLRRWVGLRSIASPHPYLAQGSPERGKNSPVGCRLAFPMVLGCLQASAATREAWPIRKRGVFQWHLRKSFDSRANFYSF